jgi:RNAse (barnase) inhibitor barstar
MKPVLIDWSTIGDREDFYSVVLPQTDAPSWHGRNLDAIQDSWVTGDICSGGPPFSFIFCRSKDIKMDLKDFSETVMEIANESVERHGGEVTRED